MSIYEYILEEHLCFHDQITYFLNNKDCIIFGGFIRSLLSNTKWNKELDIICYSYEKTLNKIIKLFPPNSIKDIDIHTILNYDNGYSIDISKPFETNDFSFNVLGLINENIVIIPNIFSNEVAPILNQIDNKLGFESRICLNNKERKLKYKDWKILRR
jgi:hypothetical protein